MFNDHPKHPHKAYSVHKLKVSDNPLFIPKMIKLFIQSAEKFIVEITVAIKEEDLDKINQLAHRIKPAIDALEVCSIADSVRELENARTIDESLKSKIENIITKLKETMEAMRKDFEMEK